MQAGANAADENLRATVADFEFARQSLVANVAKSWYLATELQLQAGLAQEFVNLLSESVSLVEKKQQVGQVGMQDVFLARADLASAEDALQQALSGQQQARRALEILLGRYPAGEIEMATELVPVPPSPFQFPRQDTGRRECRLRAFERGELPGERANHHRDGKH